MRKKKIKMNKIFLIFVLISSVAFAQKATEKEKTKKPEKEIIRDGNDFYNQNNFTDAEIQYKKALEVNPNYEKANYNLGNAIYQQNRFKEALPMYDLVTKTTENKLTKAENFHNMGNIFMKEKQYDKAIEAYKNSLRNNSKDDETRYNLALSQKLLKNEADNKKKDKNNKDKNDDKKDQNKDDKDKKDKKDQNKDKQEGDKGDKDKDKKGDNKEDPNKDKQGENDKKKQNPQPQKNKLSKQQIKQLLEAMNNEENKTQKKVNAKKAKGRKIKQEKDW